MCSALQQFKRQFCYGYASAFIHSSVKGFIAAEDGCNRYRNLQDLVDFKFVFPPHQFGQLDAFAFLHHRFEVNRLC